MKTRYTFDTPYLEVQVIARSKSADVKPEIWAKFMRELASLKDHNDFMYTHSLRVGLYAYGIAVAEGNNDQKFALFAGCGHDIGKCEVSNVLLDSKNLQPHEFEEIKRHSHEGYERFKDSFLFTGYVAGLHHKYKENGYGIDLDVDPPYKLSEASKAAVRAISELVMICDFFDALTTRDNNKGFIDNPHDPVQQLEVMTNHFPDNDSRIAWLIENRI